MTIRKSLALLGCILIASSMRGQETFPSIQNPTFFQKNTVQKVDRNILNHLDLGVSLGSTGIGVDLAMPITKHLQVRAGATYIPPIHINGLYMAEVGDFGGTKQELDERFDRLAGLLQDFTGIQADRKINMIKEPTFNNMKLILDVMPFRNKKWHFSAGVFYGNSEMGKAYNKTKDMTTLVAINVYNSLYYKAIAEEPLITYGKISVYLPPEFNEKFREYGLIAVPMGEFKEDYIAKEDVYWNHTEVDPITLETIHEKGDLRCAKGDVLYHKGDKYRMTPDEETAMVTASCRVNKFRPYVGFGYGGSISKNNRTNLSFECGALLWGGTPKAYTKDGIDIVHDLTNLSKKVKGDVNFIKSFPVYPVLEVRLSHRLF